MIVLYSMMTVKCELTTEIESEFYARDTGVTQELFSKIFQ